MIVPANTPSSRLAEKLGFTPGSREERFGRETVVYRLSRPGS
jgi:hypothetical protein